ncbi:MAG: LysR family transcriptional regulator [Pseudomonadota bacterium]
MDWRSIPPLSSLRAFEATLRTGSFSAAGRELNVTHAAISQHVRALEKRLGTALVVKDGLRLVPTQAGEKLGEALTDGFGRIAAGVTDLIEAETVRPLRVSMTPSFAETWLMPRLGGFWASHPDIQLEISPSTRSVDLLRDGFDVAIRYGQGNWPGVDNQHLLFSRYVVVAAAGKYRPVTKGELSKLRGEAWVLEHVWPEGRRWLAENGIDLDREKVTLLGTTSLVLEAVRHGHGITLASLTTAQRDIDNGTFEVLYESQIGTGGYHILTRPGDTRPALKTFTKWLMGQAKAEAA